MSHRDDIPPGISGIMNAPDGLAAEILRVAGWPDTVEDVCIAMPTFWGPPRMVPGAAKPCGACGVRCHIAPGNTLEYIICLDCVVEAAQRLGIDLNA